MASNVRVELEESGRTKEERERAFRGMMNAFRKKVDESGVLSLWKQRQFFESKSEKDRRKRRQSEITRKKEKIRDYFNKG
jgi:ribosomal protein S21